MLMKSAIRSIANVRSRLDAFERDPVKCARHVVKVMFVFALLERGRMPLADVAAYVGRVPCYRQMSDRFLGLDPGALTAFIVQDLQRAGAIRLEGEMLLPTMAA